MEVKTSDEDGGTRITVMSDSEVAVVVKSGQGERIYLPPGENEDDSYYIENPSSLRRTPEGYTVVHRGEIKDLQVLS